MWVLFLIELALVAAFAIALFGYLYWREQNLRVEEVKRSAEERAELADRLQMPEVVVQQRLDKIDLGELEGDDLGPWHDPTLDKKKDD